MIDKPSLLDTPNLINGKEYTVSPVPGESVDDCYAKDSLIRGDYSVDYAPDWDEGKLVQETLPAAEWDAWMHDLTGFGWQVTEVLRSIWEEIYCIINGAQAGMAQQAVTQLLSGAQTFTNKTISFDDNTLTNVASLDTAQTLTGKTLDLNLDTNKITVGTANRVLVSDANKKIVPAANTTDTEIGYVHGVTSAIQTQLNGKQATITGAATTITSSNLTASKVLVSDASGKVAVGTVDAANIVGTGATQTLSNKTYILGTANKVCITNSSKQMTLSTVSDTELGYLSGVTSNVQTQLNTVSGRTSNLIYDTFTVDGGGYGLIYTCYVAKRNGIITLQAYGSAITSDIPPLITLYSSGLVPAAYRPRLNVTFVGFTSTGSQDLNYSIALNTDGYLILYSGSGGWYTSWTSTPCIYGLTYVANTI